VSSIPRNTPEPDDWQSPTPEPRQIPWRAGENESPDEAATPVRRPATEELSGVIERVTLHNDDSGFPIKLHQWLFALQQVWKHWTVNVDGIAGGLNRA